MCGHRPAETETDWNASRHWNTHSWLKTLEFINRTNSCVYCPLDFISHASILCKFFVHWRKKCDQCTSEQFSGSYFESSVVANRLPLTHPISFFLTGVATASNFKFCSGNLIAGVPAAGAAALQSRTRTAVANCHSRQWSWIFVVMHSPLWWDSLVY